MKKRLVCLGIALASATFMLSACTSKKSNVTNNDTKIVDESETPTENTTSLNNNSTPTNNIETNDETEPEEIIIEIPPVDEKSILLEIYEDFNSPKLPSGKYVEVGEQAFSNGIKINQTEQISLLNTIDCIEQKGIDIDTKSDDAFLIDYSKKSSADGSFYGNVISPIIVNVKNYISNLKEYENSKNGECVFSYYNYGDYYIIFAKSQTGFNRDFIVFDKTGVASYVNLHNEASNKYAKIYETILIDKGTLEKSDLEILDLQSKIKFNNTDAFFSIDDETVESIVIPEKYRGIQFNNVDMDKIQQLENLKEIIVSPSSKRFTTENGILYDKKQTKLLLYPQAKEDTDYVLPQSVRDIADNALANTKYLESITVQEGIEYIPDNFLANSNVSKVVLPSSVKEIGNTILKGCKNLVDLTVPFIGSDDESDSSLIYFFSTEEVEGMNEYDAKDGRYYIPSIEKITVLNELSSVNALLGLNSSLKEIVFADSFTELNPEIFHKDLTGLETITMNGITTIPSRAFPNLINLKNVYGKNLEYVSEYAFEGNTLLETFDFANVITIGDYAFANTNINAVESESVKNVGTYAFNECKKLATVDLANATSVKEYAFFNTSALRTAKFESLETLETCFISTEESRNISTLYLPSMKVLKEKALNNVSTSSNIDVSKVTEIGIDAFRLFAGSAVSQLNFESVTSLPNLGNNMINGVYESAFKECSVKNVKFPNLTTMPQGMFTNSKIKNVYLNSVTKIEMEAFYNSSLLLYVEAPNATIVGARAFCNCSKITTIKTSKITSIGLSSFSKCSNLSTVDTSGLTSIPENAFYACTSLNNIDTSNVTSIDKTAFYSCTSLTSVNLVKATSVGNSAFESCTSLSSIGTYNYLTTIGSNAFMHTAITKFSSKVVTSIGKQAFAQCDKLTTLESYITSIPEALCSNCTKLETINLPKVTSASGDAFRGCYKVKSLKLPLLKSYSNSLFGSSYTYDFTDAYIELGATSLTSVILSDVKLFNNIKLANITSLADETFKNNKKIKSIDCQSVTSVGKSCFEACSNLASISMESLSSIGEYAFYDTVITSFTNSKITTIPQKAFYSCDSLTSISCSKATKVEDNAFGYCLTLTSVSLPNVTTLGSYAFSFCSALESIYLDNLTTLGYSSFSYTSKLTTVSFPKVTSISADVFRNSGLKTLELPSITTIPEKCFQSTSLVTVKMNSLTSVPSSAFTKVSTLKDIYISSATSIGYAAFQNCTSLWYVSGGSITSVGDYGFQYTAITSMPSSKIKTIGTNAFYDCKSLSLNVYSGWTDYLTSISSGAFTNCTAISGLKFTNSGIVISNSAFYGCSSITSVTLPSSASVYSSAFYGLSGHEVRISGTNSSTLINNTSTIDSWGGIFKSCYSVVCEDLRPGNLSGSVLVNKTYFDYKDLKSTNNGVTKYNYVGVRK